MAETFSVWTVEALRAGFQMTGLFKREVGDVGDGLGSWMVEGWFK